MNVVQSIFAIKINIEARYDLVCDYNSAIKTILPLFLFFIPDLVAKRHISPLGCFQ